jgi:phosphoenolpyruvate-protein kinase (PTS system EI component)
VVTDGGGYLTHALIVAREFGIPAVVGTQEATTKVKSGDKIRVDGNKCTVYILD